MTSTSDDDLSRDGFLGGRLALWQPRRGYRAGIDAMLLAASVPARPGEAVLDLGCGAGAALLALGRRVDGLDLSGIELQPRYAALARRNALENALPARIVEGDAADPPREIRARRFAHVITNPPYYVPGGGTPSADTGRETALRESAALAEWVAAGARRLLPRGLMSVIQRADRLPELLAAMHGRLGTLHIRPLQPREGRPAHLVIVHGTKGGRGRAIMDAPILLHVEKSGRNPDDGYTSRVRSILRNAAYIDDSARN